MSDWNPSLYLHFAAERSRPAVELLARVPLENVEYVADLGCGPGNSTALLQQRWPAARITGIDSSPAMVAEARSALPDCLFVEADIRNWQPEQALDLIFANASLQWLPDHYELFPHLVSLLSPLGVLAVQMPDNWLEPTHVLMREVAWEQNYPDRGREPLAGVHAYYDILSEAGCEVDIWRTTYYHQMPSHQAIINWVTATGLRPWLQDVWTGHFVFLLSVFGHRKSRIPFQISCLVCRCVGGGYLVVKVRGKLTRCVGGKLEVFSSGYISTYNLSI